MLGKSASVGEVARITGLTRQTVYRIKDDPAGAEAALAMWGIYRRGGGSVPSQNQTPSTLTAGRHAVASGTRSR
jgi:hypothetical protein